MTRRGLLLTLLALATPAVAEEPAATSPTSATPVSTPPTPASPAPTPAPTPAPARPRRRRPARKPPEPLPPQSQREHTNRYGDIAPVPNRDMEGPQATRPTDRPSLSPSVIQRSLPSRGSAAEGTPSLTEDRLFMPAPGARLTVPFR